MSEQRKYYGPPNLDRNRHNEPIALAETVFEGGAADLTEKYGPKGEGWDVHVWDTPENEVAESRYEQRIYATDTLIKSLRGDAEAAAKFASLEDPEIDTYPGRRPHETRMASLAIYPDGKIHAARNDEAASHETDG